MEQFGVYLVEVLVDMPGLLGSSIGSLLLGIPKPYIDSSFEAYVKFFPVDGYSGIKRSVVVLDSFGVDPNRMENVEEVRMTIIFKLNLVMDESQITAKKLTLLFENERFQDTKTFEKNVDDL